MRTFPDIEPNIPAANSCGDSYKMSITDSTISTTTDANYKHTRPRATRMLASWSFSWVALSAEEFNVITSFFREVGTFEQFLLKNQVRNFIDFGQFVGRIGKNHIKFHPRRCDVTKHIALN